MEIKILNNWRKDHQIILEKIITFSNLPDNKDIQKKKFSLLTELFLNLCTNKNNKGNFRNVSSLILLFLNLYKKNYPVDIFSKQENRNPKTKRGSSELKRILKQELRSSSPIP
ncbi:MAG: hypothetical protein KGD72_00305 [Candidatus Lokiarchaeota archaeon]|nr:hypothetical protein [Candidatus Lokiarchaeota archaeon]